MKEETKPQNPQAFPSWDMTFTENPDSNLFSAGTGKGMTLRDYFASKAMQGMIQCMYIKDNLTSPNELIEKMLLISTNAYWYADQMLKQREQ